MNAPSPDPITLERLPELRARTDRISRRVRQKLDDYLASLHPLLAPQRALGKHLSGAGGTETPGAEQAFKLLGDRYSEVADGYGLARELREGSIDLHRDLVLHPWGYDHTTEQGTAIQVSSPIRWILGYRSAYTPAQVRDTLERRRDRRASDLLQFVLGALTLQVLLETHAGLVRLLHDLRFEVVCEPVEGVGPVPLVSIRAALRSFRPSDAILERSVQLSGVPAFIELIDPEGVDGPDPLAECLD